MMNELIIKLAKEIIRKYADMNQVKKDLIEEAMKRFKHIKPVGYHKNFEELIFWFNTIDNSSHILKKKMSFRRMY
jgi:hypothetical protein